jgi:hypothetical protein
MTHADAGTDTGLRDALAEFAHARGTMSGSVWHQIGSELLNRAHSEARHVRRQDADEFVSAYLCSAMHTLISRPETIVAATRPWALLVHIAARQARRTVEFSRSGGLTARDPVSHHRRAGPTVISLDWLRDEFGYDPSSDEASR